MGRHPYGVTVGLMRHTPGAVVDGYEEPETWADPEPVSDSAVAPGDVLEPFEANREGSNVEFTWFAPPGTSAHRRDRAVLPGHADPFDVLGSVKDWGRNPFTGGPSGVVVQLGRFDG